MDTRPEPKTHQTALIRADRYGNGPGTTNNYLVAAILVALIVQLTAPDDLRPSLTAFVLLIPLGYVLIPWFSVSKPDSQHPAIRQRIEMDAQVMQAPAAVHELIQKAITLQMQGSFEESESTFSQAISLAELTLGSNHPAVMMAIDGRAQSIFGLRKYDEALVLLEKNYEIARQVFHDNHPWIVNTALELANCHTALVELSKAAEYGREALRMVRHMDREGGTRARETATAEDQVINFFFGAGDLEACLGVVEDAKESLLKSDHRGATPDINFLVVRLYEARTLIYSGDDTRSVQIVGDVRKAMTELNLTKDSPQFLSMSNLLRHIGIGLLDYGPWEEEFDKKGDELLAALETDGAKSSLAMSSAVGAAMNILVTAISKTYARKYRDASKLLQLAIPTLKSLEERPQMRLQMSNIILSAIFCWQFRHIDADEYINCASTRFAEFFGIESPEHIVSLTLHGFILLNRGKFERSIATFTIVIRGLQQVELESKHIHSDSLLLLARQYAGLAQLCLGRNTQAKDNLSSVHSEEVTRWGPQHPATKLTARTLGSIAAMEGNFQEATNWLRGSLQNPETMESNQNANYENSVGNTMAKWSLTWALHEQGEADEAVKLLVTVEENMKEMFGREHKLTIGASHDLLWINRHRISAIDAEFVKLYETASEVLGEGHSLTKKIARSKDVCAAEQKCGKIIHKRVWAFGESGDRPMQVSDVDWLTWHWQERPRHESVIDTMLLRSGSDLGIIASYLPHPSVPGPRFARMLDIETFHQLSSLITKLLFEFPRDFKPTFVESTYSDQKEVPYVEIEKLGRTGSVSKVRHPATDQLFARKYLKYKSGVRAQVHAEVNMMRRLSHPHVVKLCCSYAIPSEGIYALLLQPVAENDLAMFLQECSKAEYPDSMLALLPGWFACLLNALDYLHERKIKHRDIKPGNILVKERVVYFTDFGSAKDWSDDSTSATRGQSIGNTKKYSAPEVVNWDDEDSERTRGVDVFSLGCVFAEMATVLSKRSVKNFDQYREDTCDEVDFCECLGDTLDSWMKEAPPYDSFIREMMAPDANGRPSPKVLMSRLENGVSGGYGSLMCQHKPVMTDKA